MPGSAVVEVTGLTKDYDSLRAVDGLTLSLAPGRVLAMVGPNGAGKTTTLRMMAGVIRPTSGRVTLQGIDIAADPVAAKRRLAWVPHDPQLFDTLTVREHLRFVASAWDAPDGLARGEALLQRFDLADKAEAAAHTLSTGMRQKLALACAGVHTPDLLMLDEPMNGLDPRAIRTMKAFVREEAERGAAVVISSHLLGVVEDMATDLLILVKGKCRFVGPIEDARAAFAGQGLEELFFTATESESSGAVP
ncbi:MAG: ABC transporter ATP-binding protein [Alphaproteobacteria bacterium]|nr:ABC transporter ATP-binding protein [Alphaproteobacteria bacterium]